MAKIGQFDPEDLPAEFKPAINIVHKVSRLFGDIKADVMGFVNVSYVIKLITLFNVNFLWYNFYFDELTQQNVSMYY